MARSPCCDLQGHELVEFVRHRLALNQRHHYWPRASMRAAFSSLLCCARSGPKAIANLGATCVCIRHRGAFPRPPPSWLTLVAVLMCLAVGPSRWRAAASVIAIAAAWRLAARGSAKHAEMHEDGCDALKWVLANRAALAPPTAKLVFGGYSSGAHVALSLLQRPKLFAAHGLPAPHALCDGVLLLSGVLGTRLTCESKDKPLLSPGLTDTIAKLCFGVAGAAALPSPVHDVDSSPDLPHLLIGCEHEVCLSPCNGLLLST